MVGEGVCVVVAGGWWLRVLEYMLSVSVCENECEESQVKLECTLKPLVLGLFIGQGLGFKGAYLDPGPTRVGVGSPTRVQVSA